MRFILRGGLLYGVLTLVLGGWLWHVRQPITGDGMAWFTDPFGARCDDPCLFGIEPGQISLDTAVRVLEMHPATRHLTAIPLADQVDVRGDEMNIRLMPDERGRIYIVWMTFGEPVLTFGDVLLQAGEPEAIMFNTRDGQWGYVSWYYAGNVIVSGWMVGTEMQPEETVRAVQISAEPPHAPMVVLMNAVPLQAYTIPGWHGFGTLERYATEPRCQVRSFGVEWPCTCAEFLAGDVVCWP